MGEALKDHPHVAEIRGEGLLCAIEFAQDPDSRTFFEHGNAIGAKIAAALLAEGVIARAMPQGDILGFAPPLCLTQSEADQIVAATQRAVANVQFD